MGNLKIIKLDGNTNTVIISHNGEVIRLPTFKKDGKIGFNYFNSIIYLNFIIADRNSGEVRESTYRDKLEEIINESKIYGFNFKFIEKEELETFWC